LLSFLRVKEKLFYGWVVVVAFLVIGTFIFGTRFSFGVFFKSIEGEFDLTRAATSGVLSTYLVLGCAFAILGGWALDRYGPRIIILLMGLFTGFSLLLTSQTNSSWQLLITYSLLLSVGTGAMYVVTVSTVSRWFDEKRGFALGIASSGAGLGQVVMAPFATYLISNFGWRKSYIVMGLIASLIVVPLSRLLKNDPYEIGALPDGAKSNSGEMDEPKPKNKEGSTQPTSLSLLQASRTSNFWLFGFIWVFFGSCLYLVLTHIVPHAIDMDISAMEAAAILSLIGGTSIAGRVLMGRVSDSIGRKTAAIICSLLQVGAMVWLIWSQELWMLYLFAIVYGFAYGGLSPPVTALISDTFGLRSIGVIFGVLEICFGIGAAIGPAMGGLIFDVRNSYSIAFLIGAVAMLIVTLLIALIRRETSRNF